MRAWQAPAGSIAIFIESYFFKVGETANKMMEKGVVGDIFSIVGNSQAPDIRKL